jgi:hypothetical protein
MTVDATAVDILIAGIEHDFACFALPGKGCAGIRKILKVRWVGLTLAPVTSQKCDAAPIPRVL